MNIFLACGSVKQISLPISHFFAFLGTKGKTSLFSLESASKAENMDEYSIKAMDVGEVVMINLHNDGASGWFFKKQDWFLNEIQVTSSTEKDSFNFQFYCWVFSGVIVIHRGGNSKNNQIRKVSVFLRLNIVLYNKLNYARILIGSHL